LATPSFTSPWQDSAPSLLSLSLSVFSLCPGRRSGAGWLELFTENAIFIIGRIADPDPGFGAFLTLDPGWIKIRVRIRDEQPGSYFRELNKQFFVLKYLNYLMRTRDPEWKKFGSGIRDGKNSDPESGKNIPDPQH
jgi:hypothetical protein